MYQSSTTPPPPHVFSILPLIFTNCLYFYTITMVASTFIYCMTFMYIIYHPLYPCIYYRSPLPRVLSILSSGLTNYLYFYHIPMVATTITLYESQVHYLPSCISVYVLDRYECKIVVINSTTEFSHQQSQVRTNKSNSLETSETFVTLSSIMSGLLRHIN